MTSRRTDREKFVVRFSEPGLRSQIADQAKLTKRSMNAEIVFRLFRSFELEEELRRANAVIDRLTGHGLADDGSPREPANSPEIDDHSDVRVIKGGS